MTYSFPALSRRRIAVILFGACAFVLVACESASTGSGANSSSLGVLPKNFANIAPGQMPSYSFIPYTVGNYNSEITGINSTKHNVWISGVHYGAGSSAPYNSFTADQVSTATCYDSGYSCPATDPPSSPPDVYIASISLKSGNGAYSVGFSPPIAGSGCTGSVCGLIYDPKKGQKGLYEVQDSNESGGCAATYLYGTSDPEIQVGYYTTGSTTSCKSHAFEEYLYPSGVQFANFQLPPSWNAISSMAYGINNKGDVVGAYRVTLNGEEYGWEYHNFCYTKFQYEAGSTFYSTQARGINWDGTVVGSYQVGTSSSGSNGFEQSGTTLYPVSDGSNGTFLNAINDASTIVGYNLGGGNHHYLMGFVGTCSGSACPGNPVSFPCSYSTSAGGIGPATRRRP